MTAVVELRSKLDEAELQSRPTSSYTQRDLDDALLGLETDELERTKAVLLGNARKVITYHHRASGAFIYLHPSVYGSGGMNARIEKSARALGVDAVTFRRWVSLQDQRSIAFMEKWVPLVKDMTWGDVKKNFEGSWADQWDIDSAATVTDLLAPYENRIKDTALTVLSKYAPGTTTASRKSAAKNDDATTVISGSAKLFERKDTGKARKYVEQEKFVAKTVKERWDAGDPIGKAELYMELSARDDCRAGTEFYQNYFDPFKKSAASGLSNWMKRVLDRFGWSPRKNSIGQVVPENWRELSEENAKMIREEFAKLGVNIVINADQTFVYFYPEEDVVIAPIGTKRVGGKVKADCKAGFTAMVGLELNSSTMIAPFAVFDGTKLKDAKNPRNTLAHKFRNWRDAAKGRAGKMAFQKKHWFDGDITIEWLDFVLDVVYPGKKVGITMDMAPCHNTGAVAEYIKRREAEGRLVLRFIQGGLTSVIQVADLVANKELKAKIKKKYLAWRSDYLRAERAKTPNNLNRRIKIKITVDKMMEIIEECVVEFNADQRKTRSVEKTFRFAGQDPWVECENEFKAHLDSLAKLPLYQLIENGVTSNTPAKLPGDDGVETIESQYPAGKEDDDGDEAMADDDAEEQWNGEAYEGDRVAKMVNDKVHFGTVMKFGYIEEGDEKVDAWCVKFDKKIVTYVDSRGKGYKEDFVREELEAAIELYEENKEEDK